MKKKRLLVYFLVLFIAFIILIFSVFVGASGIRLPDMRDATEMAILLMRIKRTLCGFITGAALSCAGLVFQTVLRNPLAEPYILGVSSGAGVGAALAIIFFGGAISLFAIPVFAFIGAGIAFLTVFLLAAKSGRIAVYNLIISGVIISSVGSSLLMFLITVLPAEGLHTVIWWMLGNLEPTSDRLLYLTSFIVVLSSLLLILMGKELNALSLGWEIAHSVGVRSHLIVVLALTFSTIMTSAVVGLSGIIGFVGLIIPHITRALIGSLHHRSIPFAMIFGGAFLTFCDAIGRWIIAPIEIPVGAITALCGGPFFLFILIRRKKDSWAE